MKVINVSMFKNKTIDEAIHETIKEHFSKAHSKILLSNLEINGQLGEASYAVKNGVTSQYVTTTYFIVNKCHQDFIRVEICDGVKSEVLLEIK